MIRSISASSSSTVSAGYQQHQRISSISVSAASVHQQHQRISSISRSAASADQQHQCISYMHRMGYLPIYINSGHISLYTLTPPDMLRHHQTCSRHHQTCTRHHQIPPDMRHIYYKYWHQCSKSIYIGINADVTDAGQSTSEDRATQLLICEPLSFAICLLSLLTLTMHFLSTVRHWLQAEAECHLESSTLISAFLYL